jgi:hypothetical protein
MFFPEFFGALKPPKTPKKKNKRMKVKKSGMIFRLPGKFCQSMAKKVIESQYSGQTYPVPLWRFFGNLRGKRADPQCTDHRMA